MPAQSKQKSDQETNAQVKENILMEALKDVAFDGWSHDLMMQATERAGYPRDMAVAVFPEGVSDLVAFFSEWADAKMMLAVQNIDPQDLRVRARVAKAAMERFKALEPYKEGVGAAAKYWARPFRSLRAKRLIWATADKIWDWAGDTAEDYNRYTKRGLLSYVLTATTVYWLSKQEADMTHVEDFLRARIEEVLKVGQAAGKFKDLGEMAGKFASVFPFFGQKSDGKL